MTEKRYACRKCTMTLRILDRERDGTTKSMCPDCRIPFEHGHDGPYGSLRAYVVAAKMDKAMPEWREDIIDYDPDKPRRAFSPDMLRRIITAVSEASGVPREGLLSPNRARHWSIPRQVAMYLMRSLTRAGYDTIARHLQRRDPTTVMHGERRVARAVRERDGRYTDILGAATRILSEGA